MLQITEENLTILEERAKTLEIEKTSLERAFVEKVKMLERERKQQQTEVDKKVLVLKEREKVSNNHLIISLKDLTLPSRLLPSPHLQQLKLTQMKIKEITKFIKASAADNEKSEIFSTY